MPLGKMSEITSMTMDAGTTGARGKEVTKGAKKGQSVIASRCSLDFGQAFLSDFLLLIQ